MKANTLMASAGLVIAAAFSNGAQAQTTNNYNCREGQNQQQCQEQGQGQGQEQRIGDTTATTGAVTTSNGGNSITNINQAAKQATHMNVAPAIGNLSGCVVQSGLGITASVVGAGALGFSTTTGAKMVEGCTQAEMNKTLVLLGAGSKDPAKIAAAFYIAKQEKALEYLGTDEGKAAMALFARPNVAPALGYQAPAAANPVILTQTFTGAQSASQKEFVCVVPKKGDSTKTEPGKIVIIGGAPACVPSGN